MKLFCKGKDKVVHVKITNDSLPLTTPVMVAPSPVAEAGVTRFNYELALKCAAVLALAVNSMLAVMGYVDFTGRLETLGISTNEIDLGLPTLLFQGYLSVVLSAYEQAADWSIWGAFAVLIVPTIVFYYPVSKLLTSQGRLDKGMFSMLLTLCLLTISVIPTFGLKRGQDAAYSTFENQNRDGEAQSVRRLTTKMTIITKEGKSLSGDTVFASTLYTYILQGPELYKIANRDNHVVSVTKITAIRRSKPDLKGTVPKVSAEPQSPAQTPDKPSTQSTPDPHRR